MFGVMFNLFKRLVGMMCYQFIYVFFYFQDFMGVDFNICCLFLIVVQWLVDYYVGVWQVEVFVFCFGGQQECVYRSGLFYIDGVDIWFDELYGVIN